MAKKTGTGVNIGSVSILVIFVLLCLTTFATLSLVSANADAKLTDTAANSLASFYKADTKAEEILASVDNCLKKNSEFANDRAEYFAACEKSLQELEEISSINNTQGLEVSYNLPINDKKELQVVLKILYPSDEEGKRFMIKRWQTVNIGDWEIDESIELWDGKIEIAE